MSSMWAGIAAIALSSRSLANGTYICLTVSWFRCIADSTVSRCSLVAIYRFAPHVIHAETSNTPANTYGFCSRIMHTLDVACGRDKMSVSELETAAECVAQKCTQVRLWWGLGRRVSARAEQMVVILLLRSKHASLYGCCY